MRIALKLLEKNRKNLRVQERYGEDLPTAVLRTQIEDLRKMLDPSIYQKRTKKAKD